MNVALGAATQWLFNFIIARSKCGILFLLNSSMTLLTTYLPAVLTMQQTMGEAGYVCATPDQVQVQLYQANRRCRECSSCLDPFVSSWVPSFGSLSPKPRGSAWRRWTICSAWLPWLIKRRLIRRRKQLSPGAVMTCEGDWRFDAAGLE